MRTRFYKLFLVGQMEKEERWLNEMADHGYLVNSVSKFWFDFDEVEAGKYRIQVLFLKGGKNSAKNRDFYRFLEEMGISYVDGMNFPGTCYVYLKMKKDDYPEQLEMYSDADSKIRYNRVVIWYMLFASIVMSLLAALNLSLWMKDYNPSRWANLVMVILLGCIVIYAIVKMISLLIVNHKLKREKRIHE